MRRFLLCVLAILAGGAASPTSAQQWSGHASLSLSGGHQTNLYLNPVLGTWNTDVPSPFMALTSQLGLTRNTSRTRLGVTVRAQVHPRRADSPQFTQSNLRFDYRLHSNWTIGLLGGGTRYRYPAFRETANSARDSWWALPALRWTPTSETMLTVRTGLTQRIEQLPSLTDRQTSGLASLRATHWLTERVQGEARLYYSTGRTSAAETTFGGSGGTLSATYWPTNTVSLQGTVAIERLQYERGQPSGIARDRLFRAGTEVEWTPRSSLTLFGRARALRADLDHGGAGKDAYLAVGLRLHLQGGLGGSAAPPPQQRVCVPTDEGLHIRVPYDGAGKVYVTGDFNQWADPGIPLQQTDADIWQTTLDLPPGRYAYRLRVEKESESHWLDLPSYARTTEDAFGGTNGICTVQ